MNEKFVMPWEERPADCKEVMGAIRRIPSSDATRYLHRIVFSIVR